MRRLVVIVALSMAGLAAACSGSSGGSGETSNAPPAASTPTAAELERAALTSAKATLTGDPDEAYQYLSVACRQKLTPEAWRQQLADGRVLLEGMIGVKLADLVIEGVRVESVTGNTGKVTVLATMPDGSPFNPEGDKWTFEEGQWRTSECSNSG